MTLTWSDDEQAVIDAIRCTGRFRSEADAIRGALWWYARFLDIDVPADVFALARKPRRGRRALDEPADLLGCEEQEGFLG
jgi:hypothetical protein